MNKDILENTVSVKTQFTDSKYIWFTIKDNAKLKILFIGNSITRHAPLESIGWYHDCGMAASSLENDYVHVLIRELEKKYGNISYCMCQAVNWEYNFNKDLEVLKEYDIVKEFDADIVIIRFGENSNMELLKTEDFYKHFDFMTKYFYNDHCKKIVTSLFWRYEPIDIPIEKVAKDNGYIYVPIYKYGDMDECKALTEYEHGGVKKHPNDYGMKMIAEELLKVL